MSGGGAKGGTQTQTNEIDPALTAAARDALDMASAAAAIPYSPNRGIQIAAFTPQQEAAFAGSNQAARAFGMSPAAELSMPNVQTTASGVRGYSTGADYDQALNQSVSPELQQSISALFASPDGGEFTGPAGALYRGRYAAMPGIERQSGGK